MDGDVGACGGSGAGGPGGGGCTGAEAAWDALPAATRNDDLDRADPPGAPVAGGWDAIDNYTTLDCVVSPMGHLEKVPQALRADWARANVSVFEEIERAQEAQRMR